MTRPKVINVDLVLPNDRNTDNIRIVTAASSNLLCQEKKEIGKYRHGHNAKFSNLSFAVGVSLIACVVVGAFFTLFWTATTTSNATTPSNNNNIISIPKLAPKFNLSSVSTTTTAASCHQDEAFLGEKDGASRLAARIIYTKRETLSEPVTMPTTKSKSNTMIEKNFEDRFQQGDNFQTGSSDRPITFGSAVPRPQANSIISTFSSCSCQ